MGNGLSDSPESPCWVTSTSRKGGAQEVPKKKQKCLSTGSRKHSGGLTSQMNLLAKAFHSLPFHSLLSSLLRLLRSLVMLDHSSQDNTGPSQNAACDKARPANKESNVCIFVHS